MVETLLWVDLSTERVETGGKFAVKTAGPQI